MATGIREATAGDVPSLEVIRQQAMEAGFTDQYPRSAFADLVATPDDRLHGWVEATDTLVLVAETGVTPVGYGVYERPSGRVLALYTAPEYQGEGWATRVLERFERRAREDGTEQLQATVPLNAVEFFLHRGFERRWRTERDGLSMVVVAKSID